MNYHNILFTPLDITVPDIDVHQLENWWMSDEVRKFRYQLAQKVRPEFNSDYQTFIQDDVDMDLESIYWKHRFCVTEDTVRLFKQTGDPDDLWLPGFRETFPELVDVFAQLPLRGNYVRVGWLFHTDSDLRYHENYNNPEILSNPQASAIHIDEFYGHSFRIVLNQSSPEMSFYQWTPEIKQKILEHNSVPNLKTNIQGSNGQYMIDNDGLPIPNPDLLMPEKYSATYNQKNYAYYMNSFAGAHTGKYNKTDEYPGKITFLVWTDAQFIHDAPDEQKYNMDLMDDLMSRSLEKFSEFALIVE